MIDPTEKIKLTYHCSDPDCTAGQKHEVEISIEELINGVRACRDWIRVQADMFEQAFGMDFYKTVVALHMGMAYVTHIKGPEFFKGENLKDMAQMIDKSWAELAETEKAIKEAATQKSAEA